MNIKNLGSGYPERIPGKPHLIEALRQESNQDVAKTNSSDNSNVLRLRDPEVVKLVAQLGNVESVRQEVIEQAKLKVASGELLTRQAAEEVAENVSRRS